MAALPDALEDMSVPAGSGDGVVIPKVDESGDVKMGEVPADPKPTAGAGGKKKKKGKK